TPLDPYGCTYDNMGYHLPCRMFSHPPFFNYWLAPAAGWFSGHLLSAAHLALLPFVLLLLPALRLLGPFAPHRRGQALLMSSPLLIVLSHAISWEVPVLCCDLLALGLMV